MTRSLGLTFRRIISALTALVFSGVSCPCLAAVKRTTYSPREQGYELDLSTIARVSSARQITSEDVALLIPTNMEPSHNSDEVGRRIVDYALKNWIKSKAVRNSKIGRATQKVETALQTDMTLGETTQDQQTIQHKIKFQLEAAHREAIVGYSGLVDAQVKYKMASSEWSFEISQKLSDSSDVVINRTANNHEHTDNVSVRWTF